MNPTMIENGDPILISPDLTGSENWIEATVIEVENNSFNGIVIAAKTKDRNIFFGRKDLFKTLIISLFILTTTTLLAQTQSRTDSFTSPDTAVVYRLFPTQNMWIFIKLNTRNGQMWQVQYDLDGKSRGVVSLSNEALVSREREANGRFFLYPTQNMYNFILLDQLDGRTWQVQWSFEAKNRGIIPI